MTGAVLTRPQGAGVWTRIAEDVDCIFDRDPAARTRFEVYTTYPGVHGCLPGGTEDEDECGRCDAVSLCEPPFREPRFREPPVRKPPDQRHHQVEV